MPHVSTAGCIAPLPFGSGDYSAPLFWEAPPLRVVSVFLLLIPLLIAKRGILPARKFSLRAGIIWGRRQKLSVLKFLGSTYLQAVQSPREAAAASIGKTHGPLFTFTGQRNSDRGISLPQILQDQFNCVLLKPRLKLRGLVINRRFSSKLFRISIL